MQDENAKNNEKINEIKIANLGLEKEVGGFRFIAEAFGIELKNVVKFFIFLIVIVFDPLAIALIIAFNGLIADKKKKQREILTEMMENDQKLGLYDTLDDLVEKNYQIYGDSGKNSPKESVFSDIVDENPILESEKDTKVFFNAVDTPPAPNEELLKAAEKYKDELLQKEMEEEYATLTDEDKKALEPEITDEILKNLQPDYSARGIDLDGDGSIDGYDLNGDGIIDRVTAHPNRAQTLAGMKPYYARPDFNWNDRKKWINDQNAVNYWIKFIKPSQYPTDFESKSY